MPGDPKKCREYALHCAEMAQRTRNPDHKKTLTDLAQTWLSLAVEVERSQVFQDAYPELRQGWDTSGQPAKPH